MEDREFLRMWKQNEDFRLALQWLLGKEKSPDHGMPSLGQAAMIRLLNDETREIPIELRRAIARALEPISGSKLVATLEFKKRGRGRPPKTIEGAVASATTEVRTGDVGRPTSYKQQILGAMEKSGLSERSVARAVAKRKGKSK